MNVSATSVYSNVSTQSDVNTKAKNENVKTEDAKATSTQASTASQSTTDKRGKVDKNAAYASQGVVYEPSDRTAIVKQLKDDLAARKESMMNMVRDALGQQSTTYAKASDDDIWKVFASGKFTVSAAAKEEAQKAISEDGYWGVKQTSDRIVEFAKALTGGDAKKADAMLKAFDKGYKQATKSWGQALPDISKQTYDAVQEKFKQWKESAAKPETQE